MTDEPRVYVLDTGPLSHFSQSVVHAELRNGAARNVHLRAVLEADWIQVVPLDTSERLAAFAYYEQRLVGPNGRNVGECGVLALAETTPHAVAVVDDRVAANAARGRKVVIRRTLGLLCDAIRQGLLTVPLVSALADDLLRDSYRLPFGPGGFARWAEEQGLT